MAAAPDSNSPAFWRGGRLYWYGSVLKPWLSHGPDQFGPWEKRDVALSSSDPSPKWMEAVWPEHDTLLWGWYHLEPLDLIADSNLTVPRIGATVSFDGGYTMKDLGVVLESGSPMDPDAANGFFAGGHGDPSVILDHQREYFYIFFGNYGGAAGSQGVGVARMAYANRSNPAGKVWKYHNGRWQEPGLGGQLTPIFPVRRAWGDANPDAFWGPAVHWNRHLNCYVMLLNRAAGGGWSQEGIYVSFNPDLSRPDGWSTPRKILDQSELGHSGAFYPQVMGLEPGDTDRLAGETARLYLYGASWWEIDFILPETAPSAVTLHASRAPAVVTAGDAVALSVTAMGQRPFTYQWFKDGVVMPDATRATYERAAATEADAGTYSVVVTNALGAATSNSVALTVHPAPPPSRAFLSNLSVRAWLADEEATLTLGYVLRSDERKPVLLRAVGPTLTLFGVPDAAADPRLAVFDAAGTALAENDDWNRIDAAAFAAAGAFALPEGSADAGLSLPASPGAASVQVTAAAAGVVLAEIYEPAASVASKIVNASARGLVGTGHVLLGGFGVSGSGQRRLLIRALGPQLAAYGVDGVLPAPVLEVYDGSGVEIAANAAWDMALESSYAGAGAPRLAAASNDAAVVVTVAAGGSYTAVVRSGDGSTGEALLEIYEVP